MNIVAPDLFERPEGAVVVGAVGLAAGHAAHPAPAVAPSPRGRRARVIEGRRIVVRLIILIVIALR